MLSAPVVFGLARPVGAQFDPPMLVTERRVGVGDGFGGVAMFGEGPQESGLGSSRGGCCCETGILPPQRFKVHLPDLVQEP